MRKRQWMKSGYRLGSRYTGVLLQLTFLKMLLFSGCLVSLPLDVILRAVETRRQRFLRRLYYYLEIGKKKKINETKKKVISPKTDINNMQEHVYNSLSEKKRKKLPLSFNLDSVKFNIEFRSGKRLKRMSLRPYPSVVF